MLTELESALNNFVTVYHKYSLVKGNAHALYRDDFKKLMEVECPQYMKVRMGWVCSGSLPSSDDAPGPLVPLLPQVNVHSSASTEIFTLCFSLLNLHRKRVQTPGSDSWI